MVRSNLPLAGTLWLLARAPLARADCAPLFPNPYDFENVDFVYSPWSTGGDGAWFVTREDLTNDNGTASLRSPDLDAYNRTAMSNATLTVCDNFPGGALRFEVFLWLYRLTGDAFRVYVDGDEAANLPNAPAWNAHEIHLSSGGHRVDFSYQFDGGVVDGERNETKRGEWKTTR